MAYSRPAPPIDIDPAQTLMPNATAYVFGSTGPQFGIGRSPQQMWYTGDAALMVNSPEFFKIFENNQGARLTWESTTDNGLRSPVWTRSWALYVPSDMGGKGIEVYISSTDESSGYNTYAFQLEIWDDGSVNINKSNDHQVLNIPGQIVKGQVNTLAITMKSDGTGLVSVNGNPTVNLPDGGGYWFAPYEMLGNKEFRGDWVAGIEIGMYAQCASTVSAADLVLISANPARILKGAVVVPPDVTAPMMQSVATNDDGSKVYVTCSEALQTSPAPTAAGFALSGGHTISAIAVSGSTGILTVTPAIANGEAVTLTHTSGPNTLKDAAGNPLASFVNAPVTNSVGAGFWKYLGLEGAVVTVPPNTRCRYGVTGAYNEKVLSGQFTITNELFGGDPAFGAIKHADMFVTTPATGFTVSGPAVGPVGAESGLFTVTIDGLVSTPLVVTPSGAGLSFSPTTVSLSNSNTTLTFTAIATAAGTSTISFTNNKGFTNPAPMPYEALTTLFKEFGPGKEFSTLEQAMDSVWGRDPVAAKLMIVIEGSADVASVNRQAKPLQADDNYYYLIRAKASMSYMALNAGGAPHESMSGLTMNIPPGSQLALSGGVKVEGWKINITTQEGLKWLNDGAGPLSSLHQCFVMPNADNAMACIAYKGAILEDCFFVRTSSHTGKYFNGAWIIKIARCSFIHKGSGTVNTVHDGGWGNGASILDTLYWGFPANALDQASGFAKLNNATSALVADMNGFELIAANQMLLNSASNYRAGNGVLNKASIYAKSVPDGLGNNRGPNPDIGAAQQVAALALATGVATSQPVPDGERIVLSGTYTGTVSLMTVSFAPTGSDGVSQGPYPVTFSAGNWNVTRDEVAPGGYVPQVSMTNAGGTSYVTGLVPFDINGVGGQAIDPGVQSPASAVVWSGPVSGLVGVASAVFNVGLDGTFAGTVRVTPNDNAGGGVFNPTSIDLLGGNSGSFTYTPASVGAKSLTLANNQGLTNPLPITYTASVPTVVVAKVVLPLTTDGVTPVADMTGLQYAWFDQPVPQNFVTPKLKGNNGAIVNSVFNLDLTGSSVTAGNSGYLVLTNTSGDPAQSPAALVFSGPVKAQ